MLDVGAGCSTLKGDLLAWGASKVTTQDPCDWCHTDVHTDVLELAENGIFADVVTSADVLEHIVDYGRWARALVKLASRLVIIITPGGGGSLSAHVYHYHEFVPDEVVQLFEAAGARLHAIRFFKGDTSMEAVGEEARRLAAKEIAVHPLGFVFQV